MMPDFFVPLSEATLMLRTAISPQTMPAGKSSAVCTVCSSADESSHGRLFLCDGCKKGTHASCLRQRGLPVPGTSALVPFFCTSCKQKPTARAAILKALSEESKPLSKNDLVEVVEKKYGVPIRQSLKKTMAAQQHSSHHCFELVWMLGCNTRVWYAVLSHSQPGLGEKLQKQARERIEAWELKSKRGAAAAQPAPAAAPPKRQGQEKDAGNQRGQQRRQKGAEGEQGSEAGGRGTMRGRTREEGLGGSSGRGRRGGADKEEAGGRGSKRGRDANEEAATGGQSPKRGRAPNEEAAAGGRGPKRGKSDAGGAASGGASLSARRSLRNQQAQEAPSLPTLQRQQQQSQKPRLGPLRQQQQQAQEPRSPRLRQLQGAQEPAVSPHPRRRQAQDAQHSRQRKQPRGHLHSSEQSPAAEAQVAEVSPPARGRPSRDAALSPRDARRRQREQQQGPAQGWQDRRGEQIEAGSQLRVQQQASSQSRRAAAITDEEEEAWKEEEVVLEEEEEEEEEELPPWELWLKGLDGMVPDRHSRRNRRAKATGRAEPYAAISMRPRPAAALLQEQCGSAAAAQAAVPAAAPAGLCSSPFAGAGSWGGAAAAPAPCAAPCTVPAGLVVSVRAPVTYGPGVAGREVGAQQGAEPRSPAAPAPDASSGSVPHVNPPSKQQHQEQQQQERQQEQEQERQVQQQHSGQAASASAGRIDMSALSLPPSPLGPAGSGDTFQQLAAQLAHTAAAAALGRGQGHAAPAASGGAAAGAGVAGDLVKVEDKVERTARIRDLLRSLKQHAGGAKPAGSNASDGGTPAPLPQQAHQHAQQSQQHVEQPEDGQATASGGAQVGCLEAATELDGTQMKCLEAGDQQGGTTTKVMLSTPEVPPALLKQEPQQQPDFAAPAPAGQAGQGASSNEASTDAVATPMQQAQQQRAQAPKEAGSAEGEGQGLLAAAAAQPALAEVATTAGAAAAGEGEVQWDGLAGVGSGGSSTVALKLPQAVEARP